MVNLPRARPSATKVANLLRNTPLGTSFRAIGVRDHTVGAVNLLHEPEFQFRRLCGKPDLQGAR
jgi:hypothetical protein